MGKLRLKGRRPREVEEKIYVRNINSKNVCVCAAECHTSISKSFEGKLFLGFSSHFLFVVI